MLGVFRKPQFVKTVLRNGVTAKFCTTVEEPPQRWEKTINSVTLLGRVGGNPQLRGNEERPVVTFSMATHVNFTVNGERAQRTDWHQIVVFKPDLREHAMNYVTKGKRVLLYGKIYYGEYIDKDGVRRQSTSIMAEDITSFKE